MKISRLIVELEKHWAKYGDNEVVFEHADGFHTVDDVEYSLYKEWNKEERSLAVLVDL